MIPLDKILAILRKIAWPTMAVWGWAWLVACRLDAAELHRTKTAALTEQGACWAAFDALDAEIRARLAAYERAHAALWEREDRVPSAVMSEIEP